jgi:hypothetical protein
MEDYIYIIALIAWVAFGFYRKQQKKAEADRKLQRPSAPASDSGPIPRWQEILLGEEEPIPVAEPAPAAAAAMTDGMSPVLNATSFEKEYNLRGIHSIEEMDKQFRMADFKPPEIKKPGPTNEDYEREEWLAKIDLRRAVIYSEILNRPYI